MRYAEYEVVPVNVIMYFLTLGKVQLKVMVKIKSEKNIFNIP